MTTHTLNPAGGRGAAIASAPARDAAMAAGAAARARSRISSIDMMRGLVMLTMLIDHVRETLYLHLQVTDPMNLVATAPEVFFTRMTAHLSAPVFVFLTGLSAWLYANPASGPARSPRGFLFKRGLLLVVLELTLVNFAWSGQFPPTILWLQVIWAIGISMMVLSALAGLPRWAIAALGLAIVFGHNLLTGVSFAPGSASQLLWTVLHERGFLVAEGALKIKVTYPVLAWIGVILVGYAAGPLYAQAVTSLRRTHILLGLGAGCLVLLGFLRGFNIYGETLPWVYGGDTVHTVMSWFNFTKYPPSLAFLLLTLGIAFLLMAWFESLDNKATRALVTFGSAPMFFYLLHLYTLLIMYKVVLAVVGPNQGQRFGVDDFWWVWAAAAVLAGLLYYPCLVFSRYKRTSTQAWVRYF
ncbi:MAG: heparan-alpha-glucosaminide N-acetyltransferase domain-containing protein [Sterolibacterium sp.]